VVTQKSGKQKNKTKKAREEVQVIGIAAGTANSLVELSGPGIVLVGLVKLVNPGERGGIRRRNAIERDREKKTYPPSWSGCKDPT